MSNFPGCSCLSCALLHRRCKPGCHYCTSEKTHLENDLLWVNSRGSKPFCPMQPFRCTEIVCRSWRRVPILIKVSYLQNLRTSSNILKLYWTDWLTDCNCCKLAKSCDMWAHGCKNRPNPFPLWTSCKATEHCFKFLKRIASKSRISNLNCWP